MRLSVVTTLYRSEPYVRSFYERVKKSAADLTADYEIIFVNDGSPDAAADRVRELRATDSHIQLLDLARNVGHHPAIRAGLAAASGDQVFLIDVDLEEEPEWLPLFARHLNETGSDLVYGVQDTRKGGWMERLSGSLFYRVFNALASTPIPANAVTARLMTRRYVKAVLQYQERELFLPAIWELAGHRQQALVVHKTSRGKTSYSFARRLTLAVKALTSFSDKPLIAIFYTGLFISIGSLSFASYLVYLKIFRGFSVMGWPSLIVSIWFLGGISILFMGVIGLYLARLFVEVKQRPNAIVKQD